MQHKSWHFALLVLTNSIYLPPLCHSLFCFLLPFSPFSESVYLVVFLSSVICLSACKSPSFSTLCWYHTTRQRLWPLKDIVAEMEIALDSKSFTTDHFTHALIIQSSPKQRDTLRVMATITSQSSNREFLLQLSDRIIGRGKWQIHDQYTCL